MCYEINVMEAPGQVGLGPSVVCGLLPLSRKDVTTLVQVTMRIHLLKLETVKQRNGLTYKEQQESLGRLP